MTNAQICKLSELHKKMINIENNILDSKYTLQKTIANIKICREDCKITNSMIEEINNAKRKPNSK